MKRKWEPSDVDAMSLAAFRWLANTIENFSIELYATDRDSFEEVEGVLRDTLKALKGVKAKFMVSQEENGCPDGYVLCDGVCAPSCDTLVGASSSAALEIGGGKGKGKGKGKKKK